MSFTHLAILADDLTGALDTAAPFAAPDSPVHMPWRRAISGAAKVTISTESRHLPADSAATAVVDAFDRMRSALSGPGTLWFKKVDSVLRGHPLTETLAMARAGSFPVCVFAPAFPAMGRITRNGRHLCRGNDGWKETRHGDLRAAFAASSAGPMPEVVIINAETQDDLRLGIREWTGRPDVLWAGSRGLAEALTSPQQALAVPPVGLLVVGTAHPATRKQVAALQGVVTRVKGNLVPTLNREVPVLLDPVPEASSVFQTRSRLKKLLSTCVQPPQDMSIIVTGGDTLTVVLDMFGTHRLDCIGEISPGLPVSRMVGGAWNGATLISKSGGFGSENTLRDLVISRGVMK